ncbi:MAG TPA: hypothetical protein VH374_04805 [Polyangia bacterium]|jgi:hypothetical protein|nr:hypothetical protein [Polyangia bacterium]
MGELLIRVGMLVWIALAWTMGGYRVLPRRLRVEELLLVAATSLAFGAGLTAMALTLAAALGVLKFPVVLAIHLAWSVLGLSSARDIRARVRACGGVPNVWPAWKVLLTAALAIAGVATLVTTLAPPSSSDATVYHLRIPHEFLREGRIAPLKDNVHMFAPLYGEMLFAAGMSLHDDVLAALIHWLLGVAAALTAGAWAKRLGARYGLIAIVIFGLTPLVIWDATSSFVDLGFTTFAALGILWASRPEVGPSSLIMATLFAGLAAGTKFHGCFTAVLTGIMASVAAWPDRRSALQRFVVVGIGAAAIASPWFVRNFLLTGNPIYPMANSWFGIPAVPFFEWTYGLGSDFRHLLTSPFDLIWRGDSFDSGWAIGPAYLAVIPLAFLGRQRSRVRTTLVLSIAAYWVFWFYSCPHTRFLLAILPMAAGLATVGLEVAFVSGRATRIAAIVTLSVCLGVGLGTAFIQARGSARAASGLESRSTFLRRMSWNYGAYEEANRRLGPEAKLAVFGARNVYYLEARTTVVDHDDASDLIRSGFTHLLRIGSCPVDPQQRGGRVLWQEEYRRPGSRFQGIQEDNLVCAQLVALGL